MAKSLSNLPTLEVFVVDESTTTNLDKKWITWLEDFDIYVIANGVTQDAQKCALLLHLAGKDVKEIFKTLKDGTEKYEDMCAKLTAYFQPKKNVTYERYVFKQAVQLRDESSINFITRLKRLAESCSFTNLDEAVKDQFISSCSSSKLRQKLLREQDVTLDRCIEHARAQEIAKAQSEEMSSQQTHTLDAEKEIVNKIHNSRYRNPKQSSKYDKQKHQPDKLCYRCGDKFVKNHQLSCRAMGKTCYKCNGKNHLSPCCKSKSKITKKANHVDLSTEQSDTESEESFAIQHTVNGITNSKQKVKNTSLKIDGVETKFIVDTGSTVNIIDKNTYEQLRKYNRKLILKKITSKNSPLRVKTD